MVGENASSRVKLFFVFATVKLNDFWLLADSGLVFNLIAEETLCVLQFLPPLEDKSEIHFFL